MRYFCIVYCGLLLTTLASNSTWICWSLLSTSIMSMWHHRLGYWHERNSVVNIIWESLPWINNCLFLSSSPDFFLHRSQRAAKNTFSWSLEAFPPAFCSSIFAINIYFHYLHFVTVLWSWSKNGLMLAIIFIHFLLRFWLYLKI